MAYTSSALDARGIAFGKGATVTKTAAKRGFFGQLLDLMMAARMRQAEREVARYLSETGGKFTDEAEREIERRFLATPRW